MDHQSKQFPILQAGIHYPGVPTSVPWELLAGHGLTAGRNHSQSLQTLANRGGLSPDEMIAIINDMDYREYWHGKTREQITTESAKQLCDLLSRGI